MSSAEEKERQEQVAAAWRIEQEAEDSWESNVLGKKTGSWVDVSNSSNNVAQAWEQENAHEETWASNVLAQPAEPPKLVPQTNEKEKEPTPSAPTEVYVMQYLTKPKFPFLPPASAEAPHTKYVPLPKEDLLKREQEKVIQQRKVLREHNAKQCALYDEFVPMQRAEKQLKLKEIELRNEHQRAVRLQRDKDFRQQMQLRIAEYNLDQTQRNEEIAKKKIEVLDRIAKMDHVRREREKHRPDMLKVMM